MLIALCFEATRINIPMPTGDMIHLGNFVMILTALLLGGLEGINNVVFLDVADGFTVSLITATSKIPGSLITGFISVILAGLLYEPVYKGVKNLDIFKDNTVDYIDNESEIELSETNEYNEEENDINNLDVIVKSNIQ